MCRTGSSLCESGNTVGESGKVMHKRGNRRFDRRRTAPAKVPRALKEPGAFTAQAQDAEREAMGGARISVCRGSSPKTRR